MIFLKIYGVDPMMVKELSKRTSANLANLFEVETEEIVFIGSEAALFFNGIDQYGFHAYIEIDCPEECKKTCKNIVIYLQKILTEYTIHSVIKFKYYHLLDEHIHIDNTYPRYITDNNIVRVEEGNAVDEEEVYDGDIFKDLESDLENLNNNK